MLSQTVKLINISKVFKSQNQKKFIAVNNINLQIKKSEFFSILGPSGCGKTTTLRMIAGFEVPTSGEIYIQGKLMGNSPPFHRPVNTVFQNYALFPHLTVAENIAFGLEMENISRPEINRRVTDTLTQVKLTDMEKRYPRQLSGGQQQRVALARALIKQPAVLLFDEPLGALDLKLRKEMQLELKQMQQRLGITFIYVTHDQEEALTMSDRIAVMYQGEVLQVGTPVEIYEQPKTRFVAEFIGESNFLTGRITAHQEDKSLVLVDEDLPLLIPSANHLPIDTIITLVVRPEKIEIYPSTYTEEADFSAIVENIVYIGTDTRYVVRLTYKTKIVIRRQNINRFHLNQYAIGEAVKVNIPVENISMLEENLSEKERLKLGKN
ncbi:MULTISPECIES: ABC transporter ATP-binding protein [unclassified Okeania]|uniref:ABC transporter ATP-binding protein n=1 Tax=unclassified Okeania TaxID=2634635 RepID=UPI0013BDEEFA|nr:MULTISPECIES: ABC transporter ATP-binding protein [unclassified Okeania]NES78923.1 ABC transporter ATP-binding protein [Okeania sp. SIO1H4]NET13890.1 ABC transporter ATP-binding protein [Okeania sp. SIO1H6]NET22491.1 ABC transporter ATP-binding protein [Okeania sp. SIO1H5]NET96195.1 ABC transporter ATP-binding protein [Okeania sp. SIO1H2]